MTCAAGMCRQSLEKAVLSDKFAHRLIVDHGIVTGCQQLHKIRGPEPFGLHNRRRAGLPLQIVASGTSREYGRTNYGVSRNAIIRTSHPVESLFAIRRGMEGSIRPQVR